MSLLEKKAGQSGLTEEILMERAGEQVALYILDWLEEVVSQGETPRVTLFIGKGNNGGDAWVAARHLLAEGVRVQPIALFAKEECSPLNQLQRSRFEKKKGKIFSLQKLPSLEEEHLFVDGLLGTGFSGALQGDFEEAVALMNQTPIPIFSIDLPSGINGDTGEGGYAVRATVTLSLGAAKRGLFLKQGWEYAGEIVPLDIGIPAELLIDVEAWGFWFSPQWLSFLLPPIRRARHKYEAGFVVALAGSSRFRGAAKMLSLAALRSGAGMVHLLHQEEIGETPWPMIVSPFTETGWEEALSRATAVCVGSGLKGEKSLKSLVEKISKPAVFDAEALQPDFSYPKGAIFTPHEGELHRLLGLKEKLPREALFPLCQKWCEEKRGVLILKGSPTAVFSPEKKPIFVLDGDPGMATAGVGDILTGVVGSFLAQGASPIVSAVGGACLHGLAGELAAKRKSSYGMIATDLLESIPEVLRLL